MTGETFALDDPEYFSSVCGYCGRAGTVSHEREIGQLCAPCTKVWEQIGTLAFCNCPAMWGRHSLSCTLRLRDRAS